MVRQVCAHRNPLEEKVCVFVARLLLYFSFLWYYYRISIQLCCVLCVTKVHGLEGGVVHDSVPQWCMVWRVSSLCRTPPANCATSAPPRSSYSDSLV